MMNGYQFIQDRPGKYIFEVEILIDRTSVEAFFENGKIMKSTLIRTTIITASGGCLFGKEIIM